MVIAWWAHRRLGSGLLEPVPFVSLLTTCLSLRLVFEEGLFGYKFMALSVMLILLAVVQRRIRGHLVVWLAFTSLAFTPIPRGHAINARPFGEDVAALLPLVLMIVLLALIAQGAIRRRVHWYLIAWLVVAGWAFLQWPLWTLDSVRAQMPLWILQLILLPTGIVMAAGPLVRAVRAKPPEPSIRVDATAH